MMKKILQILIIIIIITAFSYSYEAKAQSQGSEGVQRTGGSVELSNPLGQEMKYPQVIIGQALNAVLGVVGSLALIIMIYGGLMWMTSAGNEQRVKTGRDTLIWATLGLVVIFMSYALVYFVLKALGLTAPPGA